MCKKSLYYEESVCDDASAQAGKEEKKIIKIVRCRPGGHSFLHKPLKNQEYTLLSFSSV